MIHFKSLFRFSKFDISGLSARKYLRSISESALHYKPLKLRQLNNEESIRDRVVQEFFDSSSLLHRIQVFQCENRLSEVSQTSTPSHSFYQVTLPFKDNLILRKKMVQYLDKYIRVGRILQLMDYIAANVAYRYCSPSAMASQQFNDLPFIAVTASIDQIDFFYPISADINCSFLGYVTYVGTSSMEVQIAVTQQLDGKQQLCCSAKFVMVARDKLTGKSYKVPSLQLGSQPQYFKVRKELGQIRQKNRKLQTMKGLRISPPTYQESSEVHNLMLKLQKDDKDINWVQMGETVQRNTLLMHLQDKNLSGKIFGGFIIRLGYQLGWLTAFKFLKGVIPKCTHIDDVQFLGPVEIGSIVELQSTVSYVDQGLMHVIVQCKNTQGTGQSKLTNILRINFEHSSEQVRKVYPVSLRQSSLYIESMRRVKRYLQN